jgi:hypothetical protein
MYLMFEIGSCENTLKLYTQYWIPFNIEPQPYRLSLAIVAQGFSISYICASRRACDKFAQRLQFGIPGLPVHVIAHSEGSEGLTARGGDAMQSLKYNITSHSHLLTMKYNMCSIYSVTIIHISINPNFCQTHQGL